MPIGRYQANVLSASQQNLKCADAPTIGTATADNAQASVTFTAPTNTGAGTITSYVAVATDSSGNAFSNTGSGSPITVSGLTNGVNYTLKVAVFTEYGVSAYSAASNSVQPANAGQQEYTTPGTYSWVAPSGVTSVSAVVVGGGGGGLRYASLGGSGNYGAGGGGGALRYVNNLSVTPGNSYTVVVGAKGVGSSSPSAGGQSYFVSTGTVQASGGPAGQSGTTANATGSGGNGGGSGGYGTWSSSGGGGWGGGGGAGGYSGQGGNSQYEGGPGYQNGAGGGGGSGFSSGGGVGLQGEGSNGSAGFNGGTGGSGGGNGTAYAPNSATSSNGGAYGGGGGCMDNSSSGVTSGTQNGGSGAVRIIWPGSSRQFPSTNTADV